MMVANGFEASQGQYDDGDDAGDWHPAVSRSTYRRYLRRKARHEMHQASLKNEYQQDDDQNTEDQPAQETQMLHPPAKEVNGVKAISEETVNTERTVGSEDISSILRHET
ncbi:hypothetical protein Nepgr_011240 [Nepenthes gracilis]|uniref:Uncharacterized protein n=1 Tax=Nepenthes gracilis TaxID=150966 RepID=A0AAD3SEK1_NEPGR|nr:hypothetical protein Nepgr_011240 [Nepenthes gracilis]